MKRDPSFLEVRGGGPQAMKEMLDRVADAAGERNQGPFPLLSDDDDGLSGPDDPGRERRLPWAVLLRRTWEMIDIFISAKCGGPTRIVSLVQDERLARKILSHLCLPSRAPPRGRPWRPCLSSSTSTRATTTSMGPTSFRSTRNRPCRSLHLRRSQVGGEGARPARGSVVDHTNLLNSDHQPRLLTGSDREFCCLTLGSLSHFNPPMRSLPDVEASKGGALVVPQDYFVRLKQ